MKSSKVRKELMALDKAWEKATKSYDEKRRKIKAKCKHDWERLSDPAGSYYYCDNCGSIL